MHGGEVSDESAEREGDSDCDNASYLAAPMLKLCCSD